MAREETWGEVSLRVINEAFPEVKAANPDLSVEQLMKLISREYYPFGPRENWPYTAWLKAIKKYRAAAMRGDESSLRIPPADVAEMDAARGLFQGQ